MRKIDTFYVHATATSPAENITSVDIGTMHARRGINSPHGYNYYIPRNGLLEVGRPIERAGAHVKGLNAHSIGICLEGGLKDDGLTVWERIRTGRWGVPDANFTRAQYTTLEKLLDSLFIEFPNAELKGHRDAPGVTKACPCFDVKAWYGEGKVG